MRAFILALIITVGLAAAPAYAVLCITTCNGDTCYTFCN
jgi:hypothetical protein